MASTYLAQDEHVLALLVCDPVDGLLCHCCLVHFLQVFIQNFLVQSYLKTIQEPVFLQPHFCTQKLGRFYLNWNLLLCFDGLFHVRSSYFCAVY